MLADGVFVFPCGDDALSPHAVAQDHRPGSGGEHEDRPLGRFGIPRWTAHDLRRTALTNLAPLGIPPIVAGRRQSPDHHEGHRHAGVYQQYSYEAEKRQALDLWADRLQAIIAGKGADVVPMQARA
jgi:hypothetical protein